jgi:hypothetical protein
MKGSGEKNEPTKAVQKVPPAGCKPVETSRQALRAKLCGEIENVTGTGNEVARVLVAQLASGLALPDWEDKDGCLIRACSILAEYAPRGIVETQLAVQMAAVHDASMKFMGRAVDKSQTPEAIDASIARATRLLRLHLEQILVWQRLKGKAGQQRVRVEHVHVHQGGQAIVGAVNAPGGGGGGE